MDKFIQAFILTGTAFLILSAIAFLWHIMIFGLAKEYYVCDRADHTPITTYKVERCKEIWEVQDEGN